MPPQMVSIGGGGADPRLGMEYMETEELGDGISINRHRYNTEFGHNTCDFVSMEDQSPESVAKLSEALKRQQEDKEAAKWDARDAAAKTRKDEVMWSYEVEDCGAAECNGLYERSDDYGWRNEAPVSIRRRAGAIARERSARPRPGEWASRWGEGGEWVSRPPRGASLVEPSRRERDRAPRRSTSRPRGPPRAATRSSP